jgi:hypothetical protein
MPGLAAGLQTFGSCVAALRATWEWGVKKPAKLSRLQ